MPVETASLWQRKLGLNSMEGPNSAQLKEMGVQAVLHGTVQQVAGLALIKMRLTGASGNLLRGVASQRVKLAAKSPQDLLNDVLLDVFSSLFGGGTPQSGAQPDDWKKLMYLAHRPSRGLIHMFVTGAVNQVGALLTRVVPRQASAWMANAMLGGDRES